MAGLHAQWPELVGPAVAAHVRPLRVRDGVLVVAVDDPLWASEMRWLGDDLRRKINAALNDDSITRIEVRVVGSGGSAARDQESPGGR